MKLSDYGWSISCFPYFTRDKAWHSPLFALQNETLRNINYFTCNVYLMYHGEEIYEIAPHGKHYIAYKIITGQNTMRIFQQPTLKHFKQIVKRENR